MIGDVNASNSMWKAREVRRGGAQRECVHALRCSEARAAALGILCCATSIA
jgi:hypothetical protein